MDKRSYYVVNGITLYRLLAAPFLIMLIFKERLDLFKWLLALSFCTDLIDGYLARRLNVASVFGTKLDSIADDLTIIAGLVGVFVFKPDFLSYERFLLIILFVLFFLQTILALIRYRKITSFHTYAAKFAAIFQGVFLILLFFLPRPLYNLFYLTVLITAFELIEEIIIVLLLPKWETNVKGLYWVIKKKHEKFR
ncbi:CDP-alcohol phosphatidyltransferase family protein [Flavihumibacter profundi]|uniref:CDP-alcohol phosphatidyltransferase family protein n=1 Tax=Flavihumibacter profundi TaxID=2716883 RepID=UPI001CC47041|nr:CDP-alcohol phosphatidyltransferase family protein [Flavihumibacter profundi]MBZ5856330.1 CDP-alcohol phosphatidyltransferase family protein [Flavihumibacter profundi]